MGTDTLERPLKTFHVPDNTIFQFTKVKKVVHLETLEGSLIGRIDKVLCDPETGDLFIIDKRSTRTIFRFDAMGKFQNRIQRLGQGPGEYERLHDVALGGSRDLYITGEHEIIRVSYEGNLLKEAPIPFPVRDAVFADGKLYVSAFSSNGASKDSIFSFDEDLKLYAGFGDGSKLHKNFPFVPTAYLAVENARLYISDFLIPKIRIYDLEGESLGMIEFPNLYSDTMKVLEDPNFTAEDERKLMQNIHHLYATFAGDGFLILNEAILKRKDREISLFIPSSNRYYNFESMRQYTGDPETSLESLVGVAGDDLIIAIDDMERLTPFIGMFPQLAHETFQATDNPLLIFFALQISELPP